MPLGTVRRGLRAPRTFAAGARPRRDAALAAATAAAEADKTVPPPWGTPPPSPPKLPGGRRTPHAGLAVTLLDEIQVACREGS